MRSIRLNPEDEPELARNGPVALLIVWLAAALAGALVWAFPVGRD